MIDRRWLEFYETYGIPSSGEPNEQGWVNFPCILSTHGKYDRGNHGAVNLLSGNYRCFNEGCQRAATDQLKKHFPNQAFSPWEFLILTQGLSKAEAIAIVEDFRLSGTKDGGAFQHLDIEVEHFQVLPRGIVEWVKQCQSRLREDLDIVQEYLGARALEFKTLEIHGIGYNQENDSLIFPYYFDGRLTGVRIRMADGRKTSVKNSHFPPYNIDSIDQAERRTIIICEGETDTLFLSQELRTRNITIPVIGTPGAQFKIQWRRHFENFSRILIVPHTDRAGLALARSLQEIFGERLEVIPLPWSPKQHGKDLVDFCRGQSPDILIEELGLTDSDVEIRPRLSTIEDLFRSAESNQSWLVPGLIEQGQKVLITGPPKTRKTLIALDLLRSVLFCEPFMGLKAWTPVEPTTVLFVEGEGSFRELGNRLKRIFDDRQSDDVKFLHREGVRLDDLQSLANLRRDCLRLQPGLLILDPLKNLHSRDENSAQEMSEILRAFDSLLQALPSMTIVIIHHSPKHGEGARGSGVIWASVDTQIFVSKVQGTVSLKIEGRSLSDETGLLDFLFDEGTLRHTPSTSGMITHTPQIDHNRIQSFLEISPNETFSVEDISTALSLSPYKARKALDRLVELELVDLSIGESRGNPLRYRHRSIEKTSEKEALSLEKKIQFPKKKK